MNLSDCQINDYVTIAYGRKFVGCTAQVIDKIHGKTRGTKVMPDAFRLIIGPNKYWIRAQYCRLATPDEVKVLTSGHVSYTPTSKTHEEPMEKQLIEEAVLSEPTAAVISTRKPIINIKTSLQGLDREANALLSCLKANKAALLIGETASGKSTLAYDVASHLGREVVRINGDGGFTTEKFLGTPAIDNGRTFFQYGILPEAMKAGKVLIIEEINAVLADYLFCIYAALEDKPSLTIPETGEKIIPKEGFCIVGTMNPSHEYEGTKGLNPALYSRFAIVLRIEPARGKKLVEALASHVPAAEPQHVLNIAHILEQLSDLRAQEKIFTRVTMREGINALIFASDGLSYDDAVLHAIGGKFEKIEHEHVQSILGSSFEVPAGSNLSDLMRSCERIAQLERELAGYKKKINALRGLWEGGAQ